MRFHLHIRLEISFHSECHYTQCAKEKERQKMSKKFLRSIKNSVDLKRKLESYIDDVQHENINGKRKRKQKEKKNRRGKRDIDLNKIEY